MAATSTTETWDAAWTLTMRTHRKRLTDNIFDEYPTLEWLRKSGRVEVENGGKEIREDLLYGKNSAEWFEGYDTLNTNAVDGITAAFYPWRYIAVPITISLTEETESQAADSAKKLLVAKTEQSMSTIRDAVNAALFSAQSGKSILGLQDLVAATSTNTVGGISRNSEAWWANQSQSMGDFDAASAPSYTGLKNWNTLFNNSSSGNAQPDGQILPLTYYSQYQNILNGTGYARVELGSGNGVGSDGKLSFNSKPVWYDRDCGAALMYCLNSNFIKLKIQKGLNFAKTPFKEPHNQLAKVCFVVLGCQFVTNNSRRLGVGHTLS